MTCLSLACAQALCHSQRVHSVPQNYVHYGANGTLAWRPSVTALSRSHSCTRCTLSFRSTHTHTCTLLPLTSHPAMAPLLAPPRIPTPHTSRSPTPTSMRLQQRLPRPPTGPHHSPARPCIPSSATAMAPTTSTPCSYRRRRRRRRPVRRRVRPLHVHGQRGAADAHRQAAHGARDGLRLGLLELLRRHVRVAAVQLPLVRQQAGHEAGVGAGHGAAGPAGRRGGR